MRKLIAGGLTGVIAAMLFASSAFAASHNPTGEYAGFNECPLNRATITDCVVSLSNGGFFKIGKKNVPLKNPVKLQGGFEGTAPNIKFYGAENGDTLSKTAQPVPGGLLGIVAPEWWPEWAQEWFNELINNGFTGVQATVELTGPTKGLTNIALNTVNLLSEKGTALGLPAKIHLQNAILGSECYIGSEEAPVQINFTSGTDGALKGSKGTLKFNEEFTISTISGGALVNNSFKAPGAEGCGGFFSFLIDPLVNALVGLPAGEGVNSATLEGKIEDGNAEAVVLSEP